MEKELGVVLGETAYLLVGERDPGVRTQETNLGDFCADAIKWMQKIVASEFVWQGWTFVWRKRWNTEAEWQTTQTRTLGGKTYTLRPDSKLWIFPFPVNATEKNSNLTNNW